MNEHDCDRDDYDRDATTCLCGTAHTYCTICGDWQDGCVP